MSLPLSVLIIEDNNSDLELMLYELHRAGYDPHWRQVQGEAQYLAALESVPELILADYRLPQFSGLRALQLLNERGLDIPFIIVSGTIGEDQAVEAMKQGAADYLIKDRLARLGLAARHALEKKRLREEKRAAELALLNERDLLHTLMDNIPDAIYFSDSALRFTRVNRAHARAAGYDDPEQLIGKTDLDIYPEEFARQAFAEEQAIIRSGQPSIDQVEMIPGASGEERWFSATKAPVLDRQGTVTGLVGVSREITERVRAERQIEADLQEKTALLQEVHHRVKNNLAVIAALLEMQANASQDEQVRAAFRISQGRIQAMAHIHNQLYRSHSLARIDLAAYIKDLTGDIITRDLLNRVEIRLDLQQVYLNVDQAVPCGLILNELMTNAIQHAFLPGSGLKSDALANRKNLAGLETEQPLITVSLRQENDRRILQVSDNGCGLPEQWDVKQAKTLGLKLVTRLVGQLGGELAVESAPQLGSSFYITFPMKT